MRTLTAKLTRTRHGEPLACLDLPGDGAELTPAQLRGLAHVLMELATDCEAHGGYKKPLPAKTRQYTWRAEQ